MKCAFENSLPLFLFLKFRCLSRGTSDAGVQALGEPPQVPEVSKGLPVARAGTVLAHGIECQARAECQVPCQSARLTSA